MFIRISQSSIFWTVILFTKLTNAFHLNYSTGEIFNDYVGLNWGTQYENGAEIPETVNSYYFVTYDEKGKPSYTKVMSEWVS